MARRHLKKMDAHSLRLFVVNKLSRIFLTCSYISPKPHCHIIDNENKWTGNVGRKTAVLHL